MIRIPGPIPIAIHPLFWLTAVLIGLMSQESTLIGLFYWALIVFVSVLIHEMGHALTARAFGLHPRIDLIALGGITTHGGTGLSFWKQFLIVLNGPLCGLALYFGARWAAGLPVVASAPWGHYVAILRDINLFWALLNLLPILPLDGGQLLRIPLESLWGNRGIRAALLIGAILGFGLSLLLFLGSQLLIGALFFLFAFQSAEQWRKGRLWAPSDRKEELRAALKRAEVAFEEGRLEDAEKALYEVLNQTQEGVLFLMATQALADLRSRKGRWREVYDMLQPIQGRLTPEGLLLFQEASFHQGDYGQVVALSGECYRLAPSAEVALRNAQACGALAQTRPALGWLQTVWQEGGELFPDVLQDHHFDPIREDPLFTQFLQSMGSRS